MAVCGSMQAKVEVMLQCYFWPSACSFGHPEPLSDLEWSSWTCKCIGAGGIVIQVFPLGGHQELMSQCISLVRLCHQEENTIWQSEDYLPL